MKLKRHWGHVCVKFGLFVFFFKKKGMDDSFINEQILIDHLLEPKNSIVCCSNLRRAISTTILGLKPRFDAYPEEKVHILSCMQEFGKIYLNA